MTFAVALLSAVGAVVDRWPLALDREAIVGLQHWDGHRWLDPVIVQLTALGSVPVLVLAVLAAAGLLLAAGRLMLAMTTLVGTASGGVVVTLLKTEVGRPRPTIVPHLVVANGLSFPSGHAAGSAIVYLTLAALTAQAVPRRAVRRYVLATAVVFVALIGISRVYLGVHWPSDVLAGWCFGALWAWGWWLATAGLRTGSAD